MPDFSHLYQRPAGLSPKPKALPADLYPEIIRSYSFEEINRPSIFTRPRPCGPHQHHTAGMAGLRSSPGTRHRGWQWSFNSNRPVQKAISDRLRYARRLHAPVMVLL